MSNFYKFENQPALESSKRRAVISACASPLLRERRSRQYDAFVTDFVARQPGNRHQRRSSGSFQAIDEPPTLISYIVYVGYRTDVMKANLYGSNSSLNRHRATM
jgi:hypothetical protein